MKDIKITTYVWGFATSEKATLNLIARCKNNVGYNLQEMIFDRSV
jgi:hypothetical protein